MASPDGGQLPGPSSQHGNMQFAAARDIIIACSASGNQTNEGSRRGRKSIVRGNRMKRTDDQWKSMVRAFELEATENGLDIEDLKMIWNFITTTMESVPGHVKPSLIFSMVPKRQMSSKLVTDIVYWMARQPVAPTNPKDQSYQIISKFLMYLAELVEHGLLEDNPFKNPVYYGYLMAIQRRHGTTQIVQGVCRLLKLVTTTADQLRPSIIGEIDAMQRRALDKSQAQALSDLMRFFKRMEPKAIPENTLMFRVGGTNRVMVDIDLRDRVLRAANRAAGLDPLPIQPNENLQPGTRRKSNLFRANPHSGDDHVHSFFPEFKPRVLVPIHLYENALCLRNLNARDRMLYLALMREYIIMASEPDIFNRFLSWVSLNFNYKFNTYDEQESHRYEFVLDRCASLTRLLDESLIPVEDWLLEFLIDWDGVLFRSKVFMFLRYMSVFDFKDGYMCILDKFEHMFLSGELSDRMEIWSVLEALFLRWLSASSNFKLAGERDERSPADMARTLYAFMYGLVGEYAACFGVGENLFLLVILDSFQKFVLKFKSLGGRGPFLPSPPRALWYMVLASDSLILLNMFCKIALEMEGLTPPSKSLSYRDIQKLTQEVQMFFENGPSLENIFKTEMRAERKGGQTQEELRNFNRIWKRFNYLSVDCLASYRFTVPAVGTVPSYTYMETEGYLENNAQYVAAFVRVTNREND